MPQPTKWLIVTLISKMMVVLLMLMLAMFSTSLMLMTRQTATAVTVSVIFCSINCCTHVAKTKAEHKALKGNKKGHQHYKKQN